MSAESRSSATPPSGQKLLPEPADIASENRSAAENAPAVAAVPASTRIATPAKQLSELPRDELDHLAEEFGLDPTRHKTRPDLVAAIHDRRQMIATLDREALLEVVKWGRRPVSANASKEQLAQEIARIRSMKFAGLSERGLACLARLRGVELKSADAVPVMVKKLKKQEGLFEKLNRKRRSMIAGWVAGMIGESESAAPYGYLPPAPGTGSNPGTGSFKEEIEESGLIGGITSRLKKTADSYVNQKLDEIEARIDRKLDEIDRRLAEWRDKEIANRIRILKITLWASVIVGAFSLIYSYVTVYFFPSSRPPPQPQQKAQVQQQ